MELTNGANQWSYLPTIACGDFFTLAVLEIILGIDNVVFIALTVNKLPAKHRQKVRVIGLSLAFLFRVLMLLGVVWIITITKPLFSLLNVDFSGKSLMLLAGGIYLLYKEINPKGNMASVIVQIIFY